MAILLSKMVATMVGTIIKAVPIFVFFMILHVFICSEETKKIRTIVIPSVCGVALLGSLLALFGYYWQRRAKSKENTAKLTARMTGNLEEEV